MGFAVAVVVDEMLHEYFRSFNKGFERQWMNFLLFLILLVSCWHEFLLVHFFSLHCFFNFFPILKNSFTQTFQTKFIIEILLMLVTT